MHSYTYQTLSKEILKNKAKIVLVSLPKVLY